MNCPLVIIYLKFNEPTVSRETLMCLLVDLVKLMMLALRS
jgi:hypothetical protein